MATTQSTLAGAATKYIITGCTIADGDALAANNIPAFWANPHWRLDWLHRTLEYHVIQVAKRFPRNLLTGREIKRHQKAVDPNTGCIVGYARWILPPDYTSAWAEAVVPAVSADDEAFCRRVASTCHWDPDSRSDPLMVPIRKAEKDILSGKTYMHYLAVHPDFQGKSIGTALVASGVREAEKISLDIYVCAFRPGVGVYKGLGFRAEQVIIQDDTIYGGPGENYRCLMTYEVPITGVT